LQGDAVIKDLIELGKLSSFHHLEHLYLINVDHIELQYDKNKIFSLLFQMDHLKRLRLHTNGQITDHFSFNDRAQLTIASFKYFELDFDINWSVFYNLLQFLPYVRFLRIRRIHRRDRGTLYFSDYHHPVLNCLHSFDCTLAFDDRQLVWDLLTKHMPNIGYLHLKCHTRNLVFFTSVHMWKDIIEKCQQLKYVHLQTFIPIQESKKKPLALKDVMNIFEKLCIASHRNIQFCYDHLHLI
jgi:hypothetical protein